MSEKKMIVITDKTKPRIVITDKPKPKVDPAALAAALGAKKKEVP